MCVSLLLFLYFWGIIGNPYLKPAPACGSSEPDGALVMAHLDPWNHDIQLTGDSQLFQLISTANSGVKGKPHIFWGAKMVETSWFQQMFSSNPLNPPIFMVQSVQSSIPFSFTTIFLHVNQPPLPFPWRLRPKRKSTERSLCPRSTSLGCPSSRLGAP